MKNKKLKPLKKTLKYTGMTLLAIVGFIAMYLVVGYCLSRITIEKERETKNEVVIYILTNGVHTDIAVPVRTPQMDWSRELKYENTIQTDSSYGYLAMGWGDKGFYLETPNWSDLKASVAFKATFGLSTTAIHATFYKTLTESETCKKILISKRQYARLISYINSSFQRDEKGHYIHIKTNANYGKTDAFYEAKGSYNLFFTCNSWTNKALKSCGQRCCLWTAFDTGIFLKYK